MRSRMGIIPKLVSQMWQEMERPHRLLDQHFGQVMHPETFWSSSLFDRSRFPVAAYYRPWADFLRDDDQGWSVIKDDKDKFHVALDVQQFKPEEINVKIIDNYIIVEGKHEEKQDDHGMISRHFVRKYMVPEQCDPDKAQSTLSSDGVLTITAPRKPESLENKREKVLKIEKINKPAKEKENKEQQQVEQQKMAGVQ